MYNLYLQLGNREGEEFSINEEEMSVLRLGPKFCEYMSLSDVNFEIEVEQTVLKYKWETMDEVKENDNDEDPSILARNILYEELFTKDEIEDMRDEEDEELMMRDAEMRSVFDLVNGRIDMRKRRATDVKGNSRVILPKKMRDFETEAKLEMMRQGLRGAFGQYTQEKCGAGGLQKSNLSRGEIRGLKSLKKRVKEGELAILPTDKTGLFAIMSRDTYVECGLSHTKGDQHVTWDDLKGAQSEINGHTSMIIKIFDIGKSWEHTSRIRETMLGETMATCPLSLLFKDHKGWHKELGTTPPTRPVAGGHLGMNLHLSEVISDLVEPLVDKYMGGRECISTEDMIAKLEGNNTTNMGWTKWSWWEGQTCGDYVGCGTCVGGEDVEYCAEEPEACTCEGNTGMGGHRVTARWMKRYRRDTWEQEVGWDPLDRDKVWDSSEVLAEDVQDYQTRMVLMGFDVESLYPNLDIDIVGDRVKEAVMKSDIKWEGINYLEAVRYIALNWTESRCRSSNLRKVLPWRRKNNGTRPGVRGVGPKGPMVGDTEQWVFPKVILTPEIKLEIIGTALSIAISALFHHHYYSFGGRMFKQRRGGPIGLRGTCAIARLIMQIFDVKWEDRLGELGLKIWLYSRYMDDGRAAMPPIKPGWRWQGSSLKYCIRWEQEDQELSDIEITKRVILRTLNGVEGYLSFTIETEEDYPEGWLPTLDTKLKVDGSNQILYDFFEKPTSSNMTVQRRTAMGEDSKIQVLSNDLVRRLLNSSEKLGQGAKVQIVDDYSQKLVNSGYRGEQLSRIITNGIKGYEGKLKRCREQGRPLHRSSTDSQGARIRKKLLAKSKWFKKKKRKEEDGITPAPGRGGERQGALRLGSKKAKELELKSVLFVEQSPKGELARRLREELRRMEPTLGFKVKVVERTGRSLGSKFPLAELWGGTKCGREDCRTCEQIGEELPQCTKTNLVYENICIECNPGATGKGALEQVRSDVPTVYIGETSRSIYERSKEHWEGAKKNCSKNHMVKHMVMEHGGTGEPNFYMKVRGYYKTALARQVAEAVMIRRRGGEGAILNSRGEFNRSYIPRLQIEEEREGANEELVKTREQTNKLLRDQDGSWEQQKARELGNEAILGPKSSPQKRIADMEQEEQAPTGNKRRRRKLKHGLIEEGWGEQPDQPELTPAPREPAPTEVEQQHPCYREQASTTREEQTWSRPPLERALNQTKLTGYFNPAATKGQTTTGNPVASSGDDPEIVVREAAVQCEQFEESTRVENVAISTEKVTRLDGENTPVPIVQCDVVLPSQGSTIPVQLSAPSDDEKLETSVRRKPSARVDVVCDTGKPLLDLGRNNTVNIDTKPTVRCEFKRGGKCLQHGCMGMKQESTVKKWCKKKDGTFGWKTMRKTDYKCHLEGVAVSDSGKPEPGLGRMTTSCQKVGNNKISHGSLSGISGVALGGLDGDESESLEEGLLGRKTE